MNGQNSNNGQNNALALNGNNQSMLQVGGHITNEDIVAVAIDGHEEVMNSRKLVAERDMRRTQASINALEENLAKIGPEVLKTIKFDESQVIAAQLNASGFGAFEAKVSLEGTKLDDQTWTFEVSVVKKADPKSEYSTESVIVSKEAIVAFTDEARDLVSQIFVRKQEMANIQADLLDIKKQLSNIPQLQRRARANLARLALSKTEEGREILAGVMGTKALPDSL